jgi:hypothetical protein
MADPSSSENKLDIGGANVAQTVYAAIVAIFTKSFKAVFEEDVFYIQLSDLAAYILARLTKLEHEGSVIVLFISVVKSLAKCLYDNGLQRDALIQNMMALLVEKIENPSPEAVLLRTARLTKVYEILVEEYKGVLKEAPTSAPASSESLTFILVKGFWTGPQPKWMRASPKIIDAANTSDGIELCKELEKYFEKKGKEGIPPSVYILRTQSKLDTRFLKLFYNDIVRVSLEVDQQICRDAPRCGKANPDGRYSRLIAFFPVTFIHAELILLLPRRGITDRCAAACDGDIWVVRVFTMPDLSEKLYGSCNPKRNSKYPCKPDILIKENCAQ